MKKRLGSLLALTLLIAACSNSSESTNKIVDRSQAESTKAAAEAEAAEEAFAQEKSRNDRGVASVKKSLKKNGRNAAEESIFIVQVGTFKVEENALKITAKLKSAGLPVFQKKIERENGTVFYAVRFEPTPNRLEAEKFVSSVKAATGESSLILSVGK